MAKNKNIIKGSGGGDDSPHVPTQASDTLQSVAYLRIVDLLCEGEIVGLVNGDKSVFINETPLQNADGTYNFLNLSNISASMRNGTQSQSYLPGFNSVENEVAIGATFKQGLGVGGAIVRQITSPAVNRIRVRISFPQLSSTNVKTGDIAGSSASVSLWIQSSGGSYVQAASRTVSGKSSSKYEITMVAPLTGPGPWNIRVQRDSPDSYDAYNVNSSYLESYTEIVDAKLRYPNSALVGITIDARQFSSVPSRYYDVKLLKIKVPTNYNPDTRTYTGSWDGTFKIAWTDNPAWVFYDLLTTERYGLGHFIPEDQVDKWALYTIAKYCDALVPDGFGGMEPRFTCNLLLSNRSDAYTILQNLASVFRSMIYWAAGAVTLSQDAPQDASYLFTPANVVDGMFTYQGASSKVRHTVALVSWNDPANFYKTNVEYVEDQDGILNYGIQESQVVAFGCTSRGQAHRLGKWLLYTEQNESETVNFSTGIEGLVARPGQIIKVMDPSRVGARLGGRISSATTTAVTIDQDIIGSVSGNTLSALLPNGTIEDRTVISSSGRTIQVQPAFSLAPNSQAVWILKPDNVEPQTFRVISIVEGSSGQYSIVALKHDPDKFAAIEKDIILEPKKYSILTAAPSAPINLAVTENLYQTATDIKTKISFSWDKVDRATSYIVKYKIDNQNAVELNETSFNDVEILDALPGTYTFSVLARNSIGKNSATSTLQKEIFGKSAPPLDVQNFTMIPNNGSALLSWDQSVDLDVLVGGSVRIRWTPNITGQLWKNGVDIVPSIPGTSTSATSPLLSGTYMIKFVDSSGNFSVNEKLIETTVPDAQALNIVSTVNEDVSFPGVKTNMSTYTGVGPNFGNLVLISTELFDTLGPIDSVGSIDFPGKIAPVGSYDFANVVDLGGVWPSSIRSVIDLEAFDIGNLVDQRTQFIDTWSDIDGNQINDVNAELYMKTTENDPASPGGVWTVWKRISAGSYSARGFKFQLRCTTGSETHNLFIRKLQVTIDMEDRVLDSGPAPLSSGASIYTVTYAQPFFAVPSVMITGQNLNSGDYYSITNSTTSGFKITFLNSANTAVSRLFSYIAKGYGRKVA
jgi:predicted phage tail protein